MQCARLRLVRWILPGLSEWAMKSEGNREIWSFYPRGEWSGWGWEPREARRGREQIFPQGLQRGCSPAETVILFDLKNQFWTSDLRNCKKLSLCCFTSLKLEITYYSSNRKPCSCHLALYSNYIMIWQSRFIFLKILNSLHFLSHPQHRETGQCCSCRDGVQASRWSAQHHVPS